MNATLETQVLIVGAGPVGMTLALDLASRGVDVVVAERRPAGAPPNVKCSQISARSMEIFRRLGVAAELRQTGLPPDYPNDVVSCTSVTGIELSRVPIPSRAERAGTPRGPDTGWPTPEPPHRINQTFFEPVLFAHLRAQPRIRVLNRTDVESFTQGADGVTVLARDLDSGEQVTIASTYLVGCDGGRSAVRHAIGAEMVGTAELQRVQSTHIRAPGLLERLSGKPAWLYFSLNPRRCGSTLAIDGRETWLIHNWLYRGEPDFDSVDRDWSIRQILGVGPDFRYEVISQEDWIARRLVASRFRDRRAFICGDAAHLWIPHGGYGMNAGIADAADLAWMISAALSGWAAPDILEAYEAERQPITEQVSHFTTGLAERIMKQRRAITDEVEAPGPAGDALRAQIGAEAYALDVHHQCCGGLNFGYFYAASPIIAYDGEPHPGYTMHDFTSSTVPGCRAPHVWLPGKRSLYDAMGPGYTLIRLDPAVQVAGLMTAAARHGVPLAVLDVDTPDARAVYAQKLTLVRPDQHVAWRGDAEPADPEDLIDFVRGARTVRARKAA